MQDSFSRSALSVQTDWQMDSLNGKQLPRDPWKTHHMRFEQQT